MGDSNFSNVSLLLPFNGANNSINFIDKSPSPKPIYVYGNSKLSSTKLKWGESSGYFDGTGDYLSLASNSSFVMGSSDFTIEMWFNTSQTGIINATLLSCKSSGNGIGSWSITASGPTVGIPAIYWTDYSTSTPFLISSSGSFNNGAWHHLAWVRYGNNHTLYINGVSKATINTSIVMENCNSSLIVANDIVNSTRTYLGYIQDIRITKGVARYITSFTAPTAAFWFPLYSSLILHFGGTNNSTVITDSSSFTKIVQPISNAKISTTQSKFGGSSLLLNGSTDYLKIDYNFDFDFGTEPFTIECWCYITSTISDMRIFAKASDIYGIPNEFSLTILNSTQLSVYFGTRGTFATEYIFNVSTMAINTWIHIALIRNYAGIFKLFKNGVASANTYTNNVDLNGVLPFYIGAFIDVRIYSPYSGYIDEFRVIKGYAAYNANFTPATLAFDNEDQRTFNCYLENRFLECNPAAISGLPINFNYDLQIPMEDKEDGGSYFIEGNLTLDSIPASKKVRLHLMNNGRLIKQTWSNSATGLYKFSDLKDQPYYVWSEDYFSSQEKSMKVINNTSGNNFEFFSGDVIDTSISSTRYYFSGTAKLRNGVKATQVTILSFPSGTFISNITPESNGNYSIYLNKGSEYIFLFIGPTPYKPESYYYKAPE